MSSNSETVDDSKKTLMADATDISCGTEFIEIDRLGRTPDDYRRSDFIYPVVEVKPEDLQDVKHDPADYDDTDVLQCLLKVRFYKCLHLYIRDTNCM